MSAPTLAVPGIGPMAALTEGMTVAAASSRLLRSASIYIGLLMLAMAGPAALAGLVLVSEAGLGLDKSLPEAAAKAAGAAGILIVAGVVGALAVSIEGGAIGVSLIGGQVVGRPVALRAALERSRRVFWRLVRAGIAVGLAQLAASHVWQVAIGVAAVGDLEPLVVEPIPGAIVSLPFVYSTVAIVLADRGARDGLRLSTRVARRAPRVAIALATFGLLSGVVQAFALGSGLDLIARLVEALHLDVTSGLASFAFAAALALAIITAAGSLLFTVAAVVSAPQVIAWTRLGLSLEGLPAAARPSHGTPVPIAEPPIADGPPTSEALTAAPRLIGRPPSTEPQPPAEPPSSEPPIAEAPPAEPPSTEPPPVGATLAPGWGSPETPTPSAWAAAAAVPARFRWVTAPMRLAIVGMWLIAVATLIAAPPV